MQYCTVLYSYCTYTYLHLQYRTGLSYLYPLVLPFVMNLLYIQYCTVRKRIDYTYMTIPIVFRFIGRYCTVATILRTSDLRVYCS